MNCDRECEFLTCKNIRDFFVYSLAIVSTMSLITLVVLMDYKNCINTPINTTYIFQEHHKRPNF